MVYAIERRATPCHSTNISRNQQRSAHAGRREDTFRSQFGHFFTAPLAIGFSAAPRRQLLRSQWRRRNRKRLRRRRYLAGNIGLRNTPFFHAKNRLAVFAIQNKEIASLRSHANRGNSLAVAIHVEQDGRRRHIVVPEIVMHSLEMPHALAYIGAKSHYRDCKQVVAQALAPVEIGTGASGAHKNNLS